MARVQGLTAVRGTICSCKLWQSYIQVEERLKSSPSWQTKHSESTPGAEQEGPVGGCRGSRAATVPRAETVVVQSQQRPHPHIFSPPFTGRICDVPRTSQFFPWVLPPLASEIALPLTADKSQGHFSTTLRFHLLSEAPRSFSGTNPL